MPHRPKLRLDLLLQHDSRSLGGSAGRRSAASHELCRLGYADGVLRLRVDSPARSGDGGVPADLGADGVELALYDVNESGASTPEFLFAMKQFLKFCAFCTCSPGGALEMADSHRWISCASPTPSRRAHGRLV